MYADAVKQAPFWGQNLNFQNGCAETVWNQRNSEEFCANNLIHVFRKSTEDVVDCSKHYSLFLLFYS